MLLFQCCRWGGVVFGRERRICRFSALYLYSHAVHKAFHSFFNFQFRQFWLVICVFLSADHKKRSQLEMQAQKYCL